MKTKQESSSLIKIKSITENRVFIALNWLTMFLTVTHVADSTPPEEFCDLVSSLGGWCCKDVCM